MPLTPEQFHTLYDSVAQPVVLVRQGAVFACNCCAGELFAPGTPLSDYLQPDTALPEAPLSLPLLLDGVRISAAVQPVEDSLLLFLPARSEDDDASAFGRAAQSIAAPLTTLLSVSGMIFPALADAEDPVLQQNLAVLNRACYQLLRATENLTDLSFVKHGRLPLALERTDLNDFLDGLCQNAGELCRQTGRTLETELPQAPVYAWIDRRQLRRALLALLSNAIKFTPPESTLRLFLSRLGKRAVIRLADCGEGMEDGILADAFHRYARPEEPEDPRRGAGFSLPVVQAIVQAHGGSLLLQSQAGSGTEVLISLPLGEPEDQTLLRSSHVSIDRSGGFVPELVELSDVLPAEAFDVRNFL